MDGGTTSFNFCCDAQKREQCTQQNAVENKKKSDKNIMFMPDFFQPQTMMTTSQAVNNFHPNFFCPFVNSNFVFEHPLFGIIADKTINAIHI